jgi:Restriction endonuclease
MKINWNSFSPAEFESLCAAILEENGFQNIQWHGLSGSDRGRDLTATKQLSHIPSLSEESKWIVQCRRYTAKPPTKSEIRDWLVSCIEHKPDYCLLAVSNTLSSAGKDWLEKEKQEFRFKVFLWEELDLIREIVKRKKALSAIFPQLYSTGYAVEFYIVDQSKYFFFCNEVNEVGLSVYDCNDEEDAKEKVREFMQFLKANDPYVS